MKTCSRCRVEKPLEEFGKKTSSKDGYQSMCRGCRSEYNKEWYDKGANREAQRARVKARNSVVREEVHRRLMAYLLEHPCVDCGEKDPVVLEFDHRIPTEKTTEVGELLRRRAPWRRVLAEMEKCDVRCANCHRRRTARQFGFRKLIEQNYLTG